MTLETVCENLGDFYFLQEYLKNAYSSMRNWFKWNQLLLFYKLKKLNTLILQIVELQILDHLVL